jgi:ketosteroid isomerase-like protein
VGGTDILAGDPEIAVTDDDTRATVHAVYDAYEWRDLDRVSALIHDEIDWVIYGPVNIFPFMGARRGRTAVLQALDGIAEAFVRESYRPEVIIVEGDRAAIMSNVGFIQRAANRSLNFSMANFLRFSDGRLIEFREFSNTFDVVQQVLGRGLDI